VQIDHVRDLQFEGEDKFDNLWPFDRRANLSAGPLHEGQISAYRKLFAGRIDGRYFQFMTVGLKPGAPPKPGGL
jgi:hypothetical protein